MDLLAQVEFRLGNAMRQLRLEMEAEGHEMPPFEMAVKFDGVATSVVPQKPALPQKSAPPVAKDNSQL